MDSFIFTDSAVFSAQENEVYADGVFKFEENKTQKIFTDWTRVRKDPE
jgi:hypothetical protein